MEISQPPVSLQGLPAISPNQIIVFYVAPEGALEAIGPNESVNIYIGTVPLNTAIKHAPEDVRARLVKLRAAAEELMTTGRAHIVNTKHDERFWWQVIGTSPEDVL